MPANTSKMKVFKRWKLIDSLLARGKLNIPSLALTWGSASTIKRDLKTFEKMGCEMHKQKNLDGKTYWRYKLPIKHIIFKDNLSKEVLAMIYKPLENYPT